MSPIIDGCAAQVLNNPDQRNSQLALEKLIGKAVSKGLAPYKHDAQDPDFKRAFDASIAHLLARGMDTPSRPAPSGSVCGAPGRDMSSSSAKGAPQPESTQGETMSLIGRAANVSEKAADKVDRMVTDDLIAKTIIRVGNQKQRINKLLQEKGSDYRIVGIEVEDSIPPKVVFITKGPD